MIAKVRMRRHYLRQIVHLSTSQAEYDVYLLSELWMRPDHETIRRKLPPGNNHDFYNLFLFFSQLFHNSGYYMTEVGDFALPTCDGRVLPSFCSGLAIVSRYPFIEVRLTWSIKQAVINFLIFRNSFWNTHIMGTYWSQMVNIGPEKAQVHEILTNWVILGTFLNLGRARIAIRETFVVDLFVTHTCAVGNGYSNAYYRTNQVKVRSRPKRA